ncbi:MAG: alpha/beta hydrolase [Alphaproteobacteria bacterium]|nr:alpha/beta hydrolase [Alphaproteobacteria bacterium]
MDVTLDGNKIFAATGGKPFDGSKPTILLLHGAGMDHSVWVLQARWLAHHGMNVLAIDLPGHGKSEGTAFANVGDYADWLTRFMEAAGLKQAALAGHSLGALICLEAAARYPERVSRLTLLGAAQKMPVHPDMLASAKEGTDEVIRCMTSWSFARPHHFGTHKMPGMWMLGQTHQLIARSKPGVIFNGLTACNDYRGAADAAAKVACPTLLILGEADQMTPAKGGKELAGMILGARFVIIPGSGHMMMTEAPDATLDAMRGNLPA